MAIIDVDLGSSDQTIDQDNANDGDTLNVIALGSQSLTVDGVDVALYNLAGVTLGAQPTFEVVNDGNLDVDAELLDLTALSRLDFVINDTASASYDASSLNLLSGILSDVNLTFNGTEDGIFTYTPSPVSLLSPQTIEVDGMEKLDQIEIDGRSNLDFSYDEDTQTGTLSSTSVLGQNVSFKINGISQAQADLVVADLADTSTDVWVDGDVFTMPVCLTEGTEILTSDGPRLIETLRPGQLVETADNGAQPLRWIGRNRFTRAHFDSDPTHRPIRIEAGALAPGIPAATLVVSPQHRVLISSEVAEQFFESREVLIPAKKLLGLPKVSVDTDCEEVTYMHLAFDAHEVIYAEGAPVESLLAGPMALQALPKDQVQELNAIFPGLLDSMGPTVAARIIPCGKDIRAFVQHVAK